VQLDRSGNLYFGVGYIFGSLFFRREYSIDQEFWRGLEEGVFEVGEWDQYIANKDCVLWRDRMKGLCLSQVCATTIYDNLLGFGLTCVLSATAINSMFSCSSYKYAKSRAHWKINEEQKFDSQTKFRSLFWTNKNYQSTFFII